MSELSPRVLHIVTALGVGGVEVWLTALLGQIRERKSRGETVEDFDILMTGGRKSELDDFAASLGASLHYMPFGRKDYVRFVREFRRLLRERRYTAIHDHQDYSSAWRFLAGAGSLPPLRIVHVHNPPICLRINTDTPARRTLFRISRRIVKHFATHVLGTSGQVLREYGFTTEKFPRQVIQTLHCGFDISAFETSHAEASTSVRSEVGWPEGGTICLFAGRLEGFDPRNPEWNHKNPRFALETVRHAIANGADVRLLVAGDGERVREHLESLVSGWGISNRVRFLGKRRDIGRLMAAAEVFLFPSFEEGLGMVAVEAQAAGVRVLASDTVPREAAVVPELVTFLPLSAGAEAWASELRAISAMPRFDRDRAAAALRRSAFSIEHSYAALREIYSGAATPSHTQ